MINGLFSQKDIDPPAFEDFDKYGNLIVEMSNLVSEETGLSNQNLLLYISTKQGSHGPRVKVFKKGQAGRSKPCVIFSIEKEPRILVEHNLSLKKSDISEIKYWISINHVDLLKLWNSDTESVIMGQFIKQLEKV